jgi:para-nitrobenzyl esterase
MPSAAGLFQRAIAQSGYGTWPLPHLSESRNGLASAREAGGRWLESASLATAVSPAAALRALDADALVAARAGFFTPIVDGNLLPEEPGIVFARGEQHDVPFLTGGNSYEGTIWGAFDHSPESFLASFGQREARARELYADDLAVSPQRGASRMFGDNRYVLSARFLATQMARVSSPAFLYYFTFVPETDRDRLPGAPHGSETPLVFGLGDDPAVLERYGVEGRELSDAMTTYWVQFARSGDPSGAGSSSSDGPSDNAPEWPRYQRATDLWLELSSPPEVRSGLLKDKLDLLEAAYLERVRPWLPATE